MTVGGLVREPAAYRGVRPPVRRLAVLGRRTAVRGGWPLATAVTVLLGALVPLLWQPRYYFLGDTQAGAFPQWVHVGRLVLAGHWPLLDPTAWRAGDFVAEGQLGLFSPLMITIGVLAAQATNAVVFVTVLKLGFLLCAAAGTYLVARSYAVAPPWAYLGGVGVTLGGITAFLDSPSWVTGQFVWALLPVAWWLVRRTVRQGANPLPALGVGYTIVSIGYVYGTGYLALVLLACLIDCAVARHLAGAVQVLVIGVCAGLTAVAVYLPGILTAPVTIRSSWAVVDNGRLQPDLAGMVSSMLPTVQPGLSAPGSPGQYVAWFLPVLLWVDLRRVRPLLRSWAGLVFLLAAALAWALGPNEVGPIRWPLRTMPVVVLVALVLAVALLSHGLVRAPSPRRLGMSVAWVLVAAYLVTARHWDLLGQTWTGALLTLAGLVVVWAVLPRAGSAQPELRLAAAAVALAAWCLPVALLQHHDYPVSASPDRNMPSTSAGYAAAASTARGDLMVVGDPEHTVYLHPAAAQDFLIGSSWFVGPQRSQSIYTTIGFTTFNDRYCVLYNGSTCKGALATLFEVEPDTGRPRVDLLSVSTLQIFRPDFPDARLLHPPQGWSVTHVSPWAVTWVRDSPLPSAGGVVSTSRGLDVEETAQSARDVELRLTHVPRGGGTVVLSRLAWPGYRVAGAALAPSTDGYLLTLHVAPGSAGQTVRVRFDPPGWPLERAAWALGLVIAFGWSAFGWSAFGWSAGVRLRRRRSATARA